MEYITITPQLLVELFNEANKEFFDNSLPVVIFKISNSKSTLGKFSVNQIFNTKTISISKYYRVTREDVKETMIHEMVHLWQWETYKVIDHLTTFKAKSREIERKSNGLYNIKRLTSRKGYIVANPKLAPSPTRFKNKLYAVFKQNDNIWVAPITPNLEKIHVELLKGKCPYLGMETVGFVYNHFEPDFEYLNIIKSMYRMRGKVIPVSEMKEKYASFYNAIVPIQEKVAANKTK